MATHSNILAWRIPWTEEPGAFHGQRSLEGYTPWGRKESDMTEQLTLSHHAKKKKTGRTKLSKILKEYI